MELEVELLNTHGRTSHDAIRALTIKGCRKTVIARPCGYRELPENGRDRATVYVGEDVKHHRKVAVKELVEKVGR